MSYLSNSTGKGFSLGTSSRTRARMSLGRVNSGTQRWLDLGSRAQRFLNHRLRIRAFPNCLKRQYLYVKKSLQSFLVEARCKPWNLAQQTATNSLVPSPGPFRKLRRSHSGYLRSFTYGHHEDLRDKDEGRKWEKGERSKAQP